jgi:hypothetical protein
MNGWNQEHEIRLTSESGTGFNLHVYFLIFLRFNVAAARILTVLLINFVFT